MGEDVQTPKRKRGRPRKLPAPPPVETPEAVLAAQLPDAPERQGAGILSKYDPDLAAEVCMRVAGGETLSALAREKGFHVTTFHRWIVAYPALRDAWHAAKLVRAGSLFDRALDMADELATSRKDAAQVNAYRVAIETLKWGASKLSPQEFGDKIPDKPVVAIQINTGLDLGKQNRDTESSVSGLFSYSLEASIPVPTPSAEIIPSESGPKRPERSNARPLVDVEYSDG